LSARIQPLDAPTPSSSFQVSLASAINQASSSTAPSNVQPAAPSDSWPNLTSTLPLDPMDTDPAPTSDLYGRRNEEEPSSQVEPGAPEDIDSGPHGEAPDGEAEPSGSGGESEPSGSGGDSDHDMDTRPDKPKTAAVSSPAKRPRKRARPNPPSERSDDEVGSNSGTRTNPIDVDLHFSLWEPTTLNDFVSTFVFLNSISFFGRWRKKSRTF